jgi:hypothetical protein
MHQFSGSLAFVAAPRLSFIVVAEEETERKLLLAVKNNLGPLAASCGYYIEEIYVENDEGESIKTTRIEWDEAPVTMSASEALRNANGAPRPKLERAKELLREQLAAGPMEATEIVATAKACGIGERTLRDAKDKLGVQSRRIGFQGGYEWQLAAADSARKT